jgi:hypothetical protein
MTKETTEKHGECIIRTITSVRVVRGDELVVGLVGKCGVARKKLLPSVVSKATDNENSQLDQRMSYLRFHGDVGFEMGILN